MSSKLSEEEKLKFEETQKAVAHLTTNEQDILIKLVVKMQNDSNVMTSLKKSLTEKKSLFMMFMIIGKRKNFNMNEIAISVIYNKYAYIIRELGFKIMPLYQDLYSHYSQLKMNIKQFNKDIESVDIQLKDFLKIHGTPNVDFVPDQESAEDSLKDIDESKVVYLPNDISTVAKEVLSIIDDVLDSATEIKYVKDLVLLFNKDVTTLKTFGKKIVKGENVVSLFEKAIKRKPNKDVKSLFEDFVSHMENVASEVKSDKLEKTDEDTTEDIGTNVDVDDLHEEDVIMKSYPKNILVDELNWKMLEIVNDVVESLHLSFKITSFDEYDKNDFNKCFEALRKRHKHEIRGKCLVLRDIIKILNIRVDNKGHQMLSAVIDKFEDNE